MEEFEDDINDIDINSWYSSVSESYFNTNETSENNFASTSAETSSNTTSYSDYGRKKRKSNVNPTSLGDNTSNLSSHLRDKHKITSDNYKQFLDETITRHICGAKYPTLNLVHPYIEILKKKFQPRSEKNKTIDSYLTLIYGELEDLPNQPNIEKLSDTDDSSSVSEDENISSAGKRRHWQFAHRQFKRNMYKKHIESNDIYEIEYLPPTDTSGLLDNVRAAIYLSLDELCENDTLGDDDFFAEVFNLGGSNNDIIEFEEDEVSQYLKYPEAKLHEDPLIWWNSRKSIFPLLALLARKYLSIPATSVPSERLFSNAGNHISSKRTRLSPELVNHMLSLKKNSAHYSSHDVHHSTHLYNTTSTAHKTLDADSTQ
ncbi:1230_t:CDS:2, partial [Cetraspora pellucida]